MATKMENLEALVGERIEAVVIMERQSHHRERGYLILEDQTHVEIYIEQGGISKRSPRGLEEILSQARRDGLELRGVWVAE